MSWKHAREVEPLWFSIPSGGKRSFLGGLLILLCHPIGWPIALGYRKVLISHLASGRAPVLPEWKGNVFRFYLEGLKAMGVIFGYLMPLYSILLCLLLVNGVRPNEYWLYAFSFFVIATMFSTLSIRLAIDALEPKSKSNNCRQLIENAGLTSF